ncbi:hypothetical protein FH972_008390 [Carpinus fangiana]|uniref:Sieve element occlusion N-terminal domain-containing protein n=1 Tax=Carpinus fangiana TaxID=176857 RepID=A0A5N6R1W4_9ROSI|nr:hypothetical protein FH972_008390 [Carpinus fangiana]
MSDEQTMSETSAIHHEPADEKFDADSVFVIANDILKRATRIVDLMVQGSDQSHEENLEKEAPQATSFRPPLYKLINQLSCELMACRTPGEQTANKTTTSILTILKSYPWNAKALLTLVAFSFEYGEFWLLAQLHSSNQLAKSVGMLKRVEAILEPPGLIQKYKKEIGELNDLTKETLEVIRSILEFEKLSINDTKDVSEDAYRTTITTIVACMIQMSCLTSDEDKKQKLSPLVDKIKLIKEDLKKQILRNQQIEEAEAYRNLEEIIQTPAGIVVFLKALLPTKDDVHMLFDGSTKTPVSIDELKNKNVLLFFSDLNISDDDISILKPIHDEIRNKDDQYKILWIPIMNQWTDDLQKKFEKLQPKMSWYTVKHFGPVRGIRFIEKKWEFNNSPILMVMNPQGEVEHRNALHMIQVWGMRAFPFTEANEEKLVKESTWIGDIMAGIEPNLQDLIKDEKHIFLYGGTDSDWMEQFKEKASALADDPIIKETLISIKLFSLGKDNPNILRLFWNKIRSLFSCKCDEKITNKLLSFETQKGWAILSKGSRVEVIGDANIIMLFLNDFGNWKDKVSSEKGFEGCFKEYNDKSLEGNHLCSHISIPFNAGKIREKMECPRCPRFMESSVKFRCCHGMAMNNDD